MRLEGSEASMRLLAWRSQGGVPLSVRVATASPIAINLLKRFQELVGV